MRNPDKNFGMSLGNNYQETLDDLYESFLGEEDLVSEIQTKAKSKQGFSVEGFGIGSADLF